jgi:hypothetical protein
VNRANQTTVTMKWLLMMDGKEYDSIERQCMQGNHPISSIKGGLCLQGQLLLPFINIYFYKSVRQRIIQQTNIQQDSTLQTTTLLCRITNRTTYPRHKRNRNYEVPSMFPLLIHPSLLTRIGLHHHSPHPPRLICLRYPAA